MDKKETYSYKDSGNVQRVIELSDNDFEFVQKEKSIHDVKFKTKPTTFMKDAFKRFCKNKSSVVAACILGILLVFSFTLPYIIPYDTTVNHPEASFLEPKLFNAGTGFWDGTKRVNDAVCSTVKVSEETNEKSNYKNPVGDDYYYPSGYEFRAVMNLGPAKMSYTSQANVNTNGGYVRLTNTASISDGIITKYKSNTKQVDLNNTISASYTLGIGEEDKEYVNSEYTFSVILNDEGIEKEYVLDEGIVQNEAISKSINVTESLISKGASAKTYSSAIFAFGVKSNETTNAAIYISKIDITSSSTTENDEISVLSFKDGNDSILRYISATDKNQPDLWDISSEDGKNGSASLYRGEARVCSFTLDTYENSLGVKENVQIGESDLRRYMGQKLTTSGDWVRDKNAEVLCSYDFDAEKPESTFKSLSDKCPIISVDQQLTDVVVGGNKVVNLICTVSFYKYKGYGTKMPRFIFGTDRFGKDMIKITFSGLQTSLLLGIFTFAICFTFGLVLGAIEGYYGGWVDIILQRLTEILSGIPWIVLMTLIILLMGSNFWTFALALCLTGWIGTSNLTRTQFYRFKGREYILASRTLGSKDGRLIFKHILPNSMGTIITSSVLMIPSVIFNEATISYLGLGLKNMNSLGIILSDNQANLMYYPYTLIVPAVVIALLMICFNLFGNGLRDAFNPSLKGSD